MVIGVILNNFKCYKGLHYIPLTNADGSNFCGLIGLNGVGKSTVLEALDCVFNNKALHPSIGTEQSYVIPICTIEEKEFKELSEQISDKRRLNSIKKISDALKRFVYAEISPKCPSYYMDALLYMQNHWKSISTIDKYILPLDVSFFVFDSKFLAVFDNPRKSYFWNTSFFIYYYLKSYTFVYVPTNLASKDFAIFETEQMLRLLRVDFSKIKYRLEDEYRTIRETNQQLNSKIDILSKKMTKYQFTKMPVAKENRFLDEYIISRLTKFQLKKVNGETQVPLAQSSSGEQKQAIMDFICQIVKDQSNRNLIIAVDEPESSFHISESFEQFNKLYEISKNCGQVLFTSHWYGFIPSIPDGCVVNIVKNNDTHNSYILDAYNYREQIHFGKEKVKRDKIEFPVDVFLKGKNDLIQSIVCSIVNNDHYNWLICEGTSDKIYLEEYFSNEIQNERLRIIPMGGCGDVYNLYEFLRLHIRDLKGEVKGKVFLLIDTDAKFHDFETSSNNDLRFKRVVNDDKIADAILVDNQNNPKQKTDIEDTLNGKAFNIVLNSFKEEYPQLLDFVDDTEKGENSSFYAMDLGLGSSRYKKLDEFFNESKVKGRFARAYIEEIQKGGYKVPTWIEEIRKFFKN